jgi:hypothetical protein
MTTSVIMAIAAVVSDESLPINRRRRHAVFLQIPRVASSDG